LGANKKGFLNALRSASAIALDTNSCIYYVQRGQERFELIEAIIERAATGRVRIDVSGLVEAELLVHPYRLRDLLGLARIRNLVEGRGTSLREVTREVLLASAELRAATGMKLPDAIVAGSAALHGCDTIVGNDDGYHRVNRLASIHVRELSLTLQLPTYLHIDDYLQPE
jgi:predicted nucleic acid-binding protein